MPVCSGFCSSRAVPGPRRRTPRCAIASADAVLFCTPEYAGTLPGSLKNLLDWTVGGTELTDKPVAWVKVAADQRRGEGAHSTLATALGYVPDEGRGRRVPPRADPARSGRRRRVDHGRRRACTNRGNHPGRARWPTPRGLTTLITLTDLVALIGTRWHNRSMDATLVLGQQGRLVIPAAVRTALGLAPGDRLHLHLAGRRLVLERQQDAIAELRGMGSEVPQTRSLVDELLAERRLAAANE